MTSNMYVDLVVNDGREIDLEFPLDLFCRDYILTKTEHFVDTESYKSVSVNGVDSELDSCANAESRGKKRKGAKRRGISGEIVNMKIELSELSLDEKTKRIVKKVFGDKKIEEILSAPSTNLHLNSLRNLKEKLTPTEKAAVLKFRKRVKAERKSRREKQRRVQVNTSLNTLANLINLDAEQVDMNTILKRATLIIKQQQQQIEHYTFA